MREQLICSVDAAKRLGVTPDRVRQLAREGRLPAEVITPGGQRLFREDVVDRLKYQREHFEIPA